MNSPPSPARRGLSSIELLVVLSILALLATLILPAVLQSREAARETICQSHLRQITMAALQAEQRLGHFPPLELTKGPFTALLPELEQPAVADAIADGRYGEVVTPDIFYCPQDEMKNHPQFQATSYGFNIGSGGPEPGDLGPFGVDPISPQRIRDGWATTAAFAEIASPKPSNRHLGRLDLNPFKAAFDEAAEACRTFDEADGQSVFGIARGSNWPVSNSLETGYNHMLRPATRSCMLTVPGVAGIQTDYNASLNAVSGHRGFVNLSLLDGSVRRIDNSIEIRVWRALGTIAGDEVVDESF